MERGVNRMKRKAALLWLLLAAAVFLTSACALPGSVQAGKGAAQGSPWIDSDVKEYILAAERPAPQDDYHLFVNYDWLRSAEIPAGYTAASSFQEVQRENTARALALFDDPALQSREAQLIRDFRSAFLDWDSRNALGVEPLRPTVEQIERIESLEELSAYLCGSGRAGSASLFLTQQFTLALGGDYTVTELGPGVFLLRDPALYTARRGEGKKLERLDRGVALPLLLRLGYTEEEASARIDAALALESALAEVCMTAQERLEPTYFRRINNEYSLSEAAALAGEFPLKAMIGRTGVDEERLLIEEPAYLRRLGECYRAENLEALKSRLLIHYVIDHALYLDRESFDNVQAQQNTAYGLAGELSDEEYALEFVKLWLPGALERCYRERYDFSQDQERIIELCGKIREQYRIMIAQSDWLSESARSAALEKLDRMRVNVLYMSDYRQYSNVQTEGRSLWELICLLGGETSKRDESGAASVSGQSGITLDGNASYSWRDNSITIQIGILGGCFYQPDMGVEELYGGIGTIIAHEISHAFDSTGMQFDANGRFSTWWDEADISAAAERTEALIRYFSAVTAVDHMQINGASIQSEAIADLAGMTCVLGLAEKETGFNYDRFFRQYATLWRNVTSAELERYALLYDSHPPAYLRTNVIVQQFQEFYDCYDVKPGDRMYLAPEDRLSLW